MPHSDKTELSIVRNFLQTNESYLRLALTIEETVELLRKDAAERLYAEVARRTKTLEQAPHRKNWSAATPGRGAASSVFRQGLERKKKGWKAEIWINHWNAHRLDIEITANGWPADAVDVRSQILATFDEFAKKPENSEVWSADQRNVREAQTVRYRFHREDVLLFGDINENAKQRATGIEELATELMNVLDSA